MKILIADDELLARLTVQKVLNDLGITNQDILQAENGQQILQVLQTESVDLAFIDIKLPDFSGLDAIAKCLSIAADTSFYILTGFGKFEYAQEAIRLGVKDFLLKPITPEVLASILEKEKKRTATHKKEKNYVYSNLVSKLLLGGKSDPTDPALFCLPVYLTSNQLESMSLSAFWRMELEYPTIHVVKVPVFHMTGIVFCTESDQYATAAINVIHRLLKQTLVQKENASVSIFYHNQFLPSSELRTAFELLRDFSVIQIFQGQHRIYPYHKNYREANSAIFELASLFEKFYFAYSANSYQDALAISQRLKIQLHNVRLCEDSSWLSNVNTWLHTTFHASPCRTEADFGIFLEQLCESLLQEYAPEEFRIQDVLNYIQLHFSDDLSVNSLAAEFHISPNYLSTRFKKETGTKFIDYVTDLRIARGKQLLVETSLQVKEIAVQVGYLTASHFIRTFVKHEGVTPNEYRSSH